MVILNIVYVLIITVVAVTFLTVKQRVVGNPCIAGGKMLVSGPELFWILTFSTGLLAFSGDVGLDLMAIRLMIIEVLCIVGLNVERNKAVWSLPLVLYCVYLGWLVIGLMYGEGGMYGVRVILKYAFPLVLALFASAAVRDFEVFVKAGQWARWVALASFVIGFVGLGFLVPGVFWYGTAKAINYISIMVFSLALYFGRKDDKTKNLAYAIFFIFPCFYWVFRTSIMGSLVAIMAFSFIKWRVRSLPVIAAVLIAGVLAVFFIPSLHDKMFEHKDDVSFEQFQEGGVTMDNVQTNSREAMWEYFEERFYEDHKLMGSGTGSVQQHFYNTYLFGGLKVIHSDFVQQKCDNGLIGLFLYGAVALLVFCHCFFTYWGAKDKRLKIVAITAGASMAGVYVTLFSDNVVNYSMCTLSMPFGFYGMMLGIKNKMEAGR